MDNLLIRALVALGLMGLLWTQARSTAPELPYRRRAFEVSAGALLCFAILNVLAVLGITIGSELQFAGMALGGALFFIALVLLLLSWRNGEMRHQRERMNDMAREYRKSRGWPDDKEQ